MNLGEIIESIRDVSAKSSTNDLDENIKRAVNRAYRKLCRARTFGALVVRDETFSTVAGTMAYALPYPLDRIINDSLRYDQTTLLPGGIITLRDAGSVDRTLASALYVGGSYPAVASIGQSAVTDFYTGTATDMVNVGVPADGPFIVEVTGTAVPDTWLGRWVRFGTDAAGKNGGDYGYRIATVVSVDQLFTIERPYRGLRLTSTILSITPANSLWLTFDPAFVDTAKAVTYDWYSKPQRLYNLEDVPEIPELSDAIVARVLADNPIYHRPESYDRLNYVQMAREELVSALKTGLQ